MEKHLTVLDGSVAEYTEKRSKFIATLKHCETEEEALQFIEEMRSKFWDARHNCFAYSVCGGSLCRFSDDGEPHGTAGKPILDVILGSSLTNVVIVVTRYFGGVLLGTGGLVRAYSKSAKDAVGNAEIACVEPCSVFETECEYTDHTRLVSLIESSGGRVESTEFTDKIKLIYCFKDEAVLDYLQKLSEIFSARIEAFLVEKKLYAFKI